MILRENKKYTLELEADGIYLYEKENVEADLLQQFSKMAVSNPSASSSSTNANSSSTKDPIKSGSQLKSKKATTNKKLLQKIPLMGTTYDLLFGIVDAIVNRSLQRDFSFKTDDYARHLRIIFSLLVPHLDFAYALKYTRRHMEHMQTDALDVEGFMALKRNLDERKSSVDDKKCLLKINLHDFDVKLNAALENYHSDDSDHEQEKSDKEEDSTPPVTQFINPILNHPQKDKINASIKKLNQFLNRRNPLQQKLDIREEKSTEKSKYFITVAGEDIPFEIVIPGFRGINHMPLRFSDATRRLYRTPQFQERRTQIPYYCEATLMSRFDFYRDPEGIEDHLMNDKADNKNVAALNHNATLLEEALIKMRDSDYLLVTGLGSSSDVRLFSHPLFFLQHLYSNGIIKSQRFLVESLQKQNPLFEQLSAYNPFVSESEAPEHAYRYSVGQKNLYLPAALHPHYNQQGKPSFPYLGEIYISLRGAEVFTSARERHQLRRLERSYRVNPTMMIGPEIESTAFSWLRAGEVVFSEVVKCPNFRGHWQNKFREKYGLNKAQFDQFKRNLTSAHNKNTRMGVERTIVDHLVQFYSTRLLNKAAEKAGKDRVLTFLKSDGTLGFDLPNRSMQDDADPNAKTIRENIEHKLKEKLHLRKPIITTAVTSSTMKIYRIPAEDIQAIINNIKNEKPAERALYDDYYLNDERLRTPSSTTSTPRSSSKTLTASTPASASATALSSFSSPHISSSTSKSYQYSGSPGTPLGKTPYTHYSKGNKKKSLFERLDSFQEIDNLQKIWLKKQHQLKQSLNIELPDYLIIQMIPGKEEEHYGQKIELLNLTFDLFNLQHHRVELEYKQKKSSSNNNQHYEEWRIDIDDNVFVFDEETVDGDGWCLLHAIGIMNPVTAINDLRNHIEQNTITPVIRNHIVNGITDNYHARELGEQFLTDQTDINGVKILQKLNRLQLDINQANNDADTQAAHAAFVAYISRNDVLIAYLNYIEKTKYANQHIGAALCALAGRTLICLVNFNNNGTLYCNNADFNVDDPNTQFVVLHPGQAAGLSHYNRLVFNREKSLNANVNNFAQILTPPSSPSLTAQRDLQQAQQQQQHLGQEGQRQKQEEEEEQQQQPYRPNLEKIKRVLFPK